MKETFTYFKLECKRAWKHLPLFLTGAIMLAALLSIIALLAGKAGGHRFDDYAGFVTISCGFVRHY